MTLWSLSKKGEKRVMPLHDNLHLVPEITMLYYKISRLMSYFVGVEFSFC